MPRAKATLFLEVHNNTRLLLFMNCMYRQRGKRGRVAALYVFDRPPDNPSYNNDDLKKIEPNKIFNWNISLTDKWTMRNHTRYKPLEYKEWLIEEKGIKKFVVRILPTNNHISLDDRAILAAFRAQIHSR